MTAKLSAEELERLEALAKAATPGPWEAPLKDLGEIASFKALDFYFDESYEAYPPIGHSGPVFVASGKADAAYIAAANPSVLLRLLAELKEYADAYKRLMDEMQSERERRTVAQEGLFKLDEALSESREECARLRITTADATAQVREAEARWKALTAYRKERRAELLELLRDEPRGHTATAYDSARDELGLLADEMARLEKERTA